ncbi:unnamed protein product [Commensalibacter communis]|uniref:Uncharacterized protein n=1 Tax=Commensalibacter communis TaxID=2972786 RepID=A0A9W4XA28_9PROT|nr:DUF5713 family protein [Commensalibacter communis]CAI3947892.1 unnamed protein product [Commensalibacter communis]CAI3948372.1 unnamed protein product [Commensalibacter communis]CAI3949526.1 unnamed protein product [Commensalibacter communis]CAI3950479.1 unnamed protein product [Commensalibacter communis]CAI3951554.1 unnamed protein product [Commensalibacter communis]
MMAIQNATMQQYNFLTEMYKDSYFPDHLVKKIEDTLRHLCEQIEKQQPKDMKALCVLTHAAVEAINNIQEEFWEAESELETAARECICGDFIFILKNYGFDLDEDQYEEAIENRDW